MINNLSTKLLGVLTGAGFVLTAVSAHEISGEFRYDTHFTLQQHSHDGSSTAPGLQPIDWHGLSRARATLQGDLIPFWRYKLRFQKSEQENAQLDLELSEVAQSLTSLGTLPSTFEADHSILPLEMSQAFLSYHGLEVLELSFGRAPMPELSCSEIGHQSLIGQLPQNAQVGTIVRSTGNHPGFNVQGQVKSVHYDLGVWHQTPYQPVRFVPDPTTRGIVDAELLDDDSINPATALQTAQDLFLTTDYGLVPADFYHGSMKWAYGGRVSATVDLYNSMYYSAAAGYSHAPLNMPIVAAVFGGFDSLTLPSSSADDLDSPNYVMHSYDYLTQATFDFNWASTISYAQLGYHYQKLGWNSTQHYYTSIQQPEVDAETDAAEAFNEKPKATALWAQWATLKGGRYQFDAERGVVSGVKVHDPKGAFEFVVRTGATYRKNIMAFLSQSGFDDFSTNDQANPITAADPRLDMANIVVLNPDQRYLLLMINNSGMSAEDTPYSDVSIVTPDSNNVAFQTRTWGFSTGINYYPLDNMAVRLTYRYEQNEFKKELAQNWVYSLNIKNRHQLSLRCETDF